MALTIPELFDGAVAEVPDKTWLLYEDEASPTRRPSAQIDRAAAALAERGVGHGRPRARRRAPNHPSSSSPGSPRVPGRDLRAPRPALHRDRAGRAAWGRCEPEVVPVGRRKRRRAVRADATAPRTRDGPGPERPDDPAVLIPTSGTTGRSKLVMQTHRAYVMAGEGFPWWMQLTADDRLMTSLPLFHINAPAYSMLGSVAARAEPRAAAALLGQRLPRRGPPLRRHRVQRDRRDARDPDAPAASAPTTPTTRCGSATRARRPTEERQLEIEARFGLGSSAATRCRSRPTGSSGGTARGRTARSARRASTPRSATSTRRAWCATAGRSPPARSASSSCATRRSCAATTRCPRRPAAVLLPDGWLRTGDLVRGQRRRHLHLRRPREGGDPPARREPVAGRGRGGARRPSRRGRGGGDRRAVRALRGGGEGVRRRRARRAPTSPRIRERAAERLARFKVPRYLEVVDELPHTPDRPGRQAPAADATAPDAEVGLRGAGMSDDAGCAPGSAPRTPTRSRSWGATWRASSWAQLTLTELTFLLVQRRAADARSRRRLLDAVLVSLADHGLTPTALAARLTYTGAPEAIQGAVAAGPARRRQRLPRRGRGHRALPRRARSTEPRRDHAALRAVADARRERRRGRRVPGLGHPVHKVEDPRTPRIYEIAEETGLLGPHLRLLRVVAEAHAASRRPAPADQRRRRGRRGARRPRLPGRAAARPGAARAHRRACSATSPRRRERPIGMALYREVDERAQLRPAAALGPESVIRLSFPQAPGRCARISESGHTPRLSGNSCIRFTSPLRRGH